MPRAQRPWRRRDTCELLAGLLVLLALLCGLGVGCRWVLKYNRQHPTSPAEGLVAPETAAWFVFGSGMKGKL